MKAEIRAIIRDARAHGAELAMSGRGHYALRWPDGRAMTMAATPGDRNAWRNARKDLDRIIRGGTK